MPDHKFKPFQRVLVRTFHGKWKCEFFSHYDYKEDKPFECAGGKYRECIPYTDETAHLLGTSQPYEPPKPPVEYEWGQKVEVYKNHVWVKGIVSYVEKDSPSAAVVVKGDIHASIYTPNHIRPLPDTAAHLDAKP